jgi:hypothetical protein
MIIISIITITIIVNNNSNNNYININKTNYSNVLSKQKQTYDHFQYEKNNDHIHRHTTATIISVLQEMYRPSLAAARSTVSSTLVAVSGVEFLLHFGLSNSSVYHHLFEQLQVVCEGLQWLRPLLVHNGVVGPYSCNGDGVQCVCVCRPR